MSIVSKITLQDDFSATAKTVADNAEKMGKRLAGTESSVKKFGASLKAVTRQNYKVNITDPQTSYISKRVTDLQNNLELVTGKKHAVSVTVKEGRAEAVTRNLNSLKSQVDKMKSLAVSVPVNARGIVSAISQAKRLESELKKTTGRKYSVSLGLKDTVASALAKTKSKVESLTGRVHNIVLQVKDSGVGRALDGIIGKVSSVSKGMGMALGAGAGAVAGAGVFGGFNRLTQIQTSEAKMRGFGYDEAQIQSAMESATKSVQGTPFGLGEATITSAGAIAAGVKPGEELTQYLRDIANSASVAGVGLDEMGSIFNKVTTSGKAQNDVLQQVSDKGIPIYASLAEVMGVAKEDIFEMASSGKISAEDFQKAMAKASGTVAEEMGKTLPGAMDNLKASFSRIGANLLGGIFPMITPTILSLTEKFKTLEDPAKKLGEKLGALAGNALEGMKEKMTVVVGVFKEVGSVVGPLLKNAFDMLSVVATTVVIPVLKILGSYIVTYVWPAFKTVAGILNDFVFPAFKIVANVIGTVAVPAFEILTKVVGTVMVKAFNILKGVTDKIAGAFDKVRGVVESLGRAVRGVADRISKFSFGRGSKTASNASGTSFFPGGFTKINEMGDEIIGLPRGMKIYPSGKTSRMIAKDVVQPMSQEGGRSKTVYFSPEITINTQSTDAKGISRETERMLRRLAVTV